MPPENGLVYGWQAGRLEQAQTFAQRAPFAGEIGDGVAVEDIEEGGERFVQRGAQIAGAGERAGVALAKRRT